MNEESELRKTKEKEIEAIKLNLVSLNLFKKLQKTNLVLQEKVIEELTTLKLNTVENETKLKSSNEALTQNSAQIEEYKSAKHDLEKTVNELENEKKETQAKLTDLEIKIKNLGDSHTSTLSELTNERNNIKLEKDIVDNELKTVKELYSKLVDEKNSLSNDLLNKDKHDGALNEKLNKLSAENSEYLKKVNELEQQ